MRVFLAALGVLVGVGVCGAFAPPSLKLAGLRSPYLASKNAISPARIAVQRDVRCRAALRMSQADVEKVDDDYVRYMAPISLMQDSEPDGKGVIMPLFPLGSYVYVPHSEHSLNIFEPRYRALYNDILFSGARRFAVCSVDPKTGSFTQYAAVFYLKELKEVSEQTGDAVKYVCHHDVIGRVKIHKILNPSKWMTRETYLKVEAEHVEPELETDDGALRPLEVDLEEDYVDLVDLQHELNENVKFTKASIASFNTTNGEGIWSTIRMWQNFQEQKLKSKQVEMQMQFQEKLLKYLLQDQKMAKIPEIVNIADLPPQLQAEVRQLQSRLAEDLMPMQERVLNDMQLLQQTECQRDRLELLRHLIGVEKGVLETKKRLKTMLS